MLEKCVLTIPELNWNQRLGHKETKLNICHHMLTSSTQLQNRSFHVFKMSKDEKCTCKACKNTVFHCQICKFVGFLLPSSSWLFELPNTSLCPQFQQIMIDSSPYPSIFQLLHLSGMCVINCLLRYSQIWA